MKLPWSACDRPLAPLHNVACARQKLYEAEYGLGNPWFLLSTRQGFVKHRFLTGYSQL